MTAGPTSPLVLPGLQTVPMDTPPSAEAAQVAARLFTSEISVSESLDLVAAHFGSLPRVDVLVAALTSLAPDDPEGWVHLGQRAWLREWLRPGAPCRIVPDAEAGPEAALTTPWMSQLARHHVVVIPDAEALPAEADQDRRELAHCHVRAVMASSQIADGTMYGSLSMASAEPGPWPPGHVADLRLLSAALTASLGAAHAKRATAEAIAVSEQARTQQQQFFATIGHELRTPVAAMIGFAEMLGDEAREQDGTDPEARAFADMVARDTGVILRAGEQLLAIVEDLLSTGRTLGVAEARVDQDLAAAVDDVIHWHRTPALALEVDVVSEVAPGLRVHARPSGVRQVLTNLIGNAIIHNRRGGSVRISATPSLGEGREPRVRVTIRDTGRGLTPDELRRVFEPFARFADAGVKGTGLGLPLARAVAERDGGLVGVESAPGEGSVFWVDLPAAT